MDDEQILRLSREISLDFLKKIGAKVQESDRLYYVEIPKHFEQAFGGISKRITFDHDVADTHSCELVVPGSNFLSVVLGEIKKQAPVVKGVLERRVSNPRDVLKSIQVHNCKAELLDYQEKVRTAVRFHFNITIKSINRAAMLKWVDIDLESLDVLECTSEIQADQTPNQTPNHTQNHTSDHASKNMEHQKDDRRIDKSYSRATEFLSFEMQTLAQKHADMTAENRLADINSIMQTYERRIADINSDLKLQKFKLGKFNKKIANARTPQSREKHMLQKHKLENRIKKDEENATRQIERLTSDKNSQIEQTEKRYRPVVELVLIAAQVYSFNSSQCSLEFKNNTSSKKANGVFVDPTESFIIPCDICGNSLDVAHLCINSHLSCEHCTRHCIKCQKDLCDSCSGELSPCYICREGSCSDCITECNFCSEATCSSHLSICPHCAKKSCYFCSDSCQICHVRICEDSISTCSKCQKRLCSKDSFRCIECNLQLCPNDINTCAICDKKHCQADTSRCMFCRQTYSNDCLDGENCTTCRTLKPLDKDDPEVRRVIQSDPNLAKFKKWSGSSNNRFSIFKVKKMFGNRIIVYDKTQDMVIINSKAGWI
ncbi:MAG: hypothetical protein OXC46_02020 [Thaumarchaeota archaeon]|nr:hypothetical protein [Nitrososphaerota archaeon]